MKNPHTDLLADFDSWLRTFRKATKSKTAPVSLAKTLGPLESAIHSLCRQNEVTRVQGVLIALGKCEQAMVKSFRWTLDSPLEPVPPLSPRWLEAADDESGEFRLAAALASAHGKHGKIYNPLRHQFEPVQSGEKKGGGLWVKWDKEATREAAWHDGNVISAMNGVMARRLVLAQKAGVSSWPDTGRRFAILTDITDFICGAVNLERFADFLWGLILLDWPGIPPAPWTGVGDESDIMPYATFTLMKLCFAGARVREVEIPLVPAIHQRARARQGRMATELAIRRLRACGLSPGVGYLSEEHRFITGAAAALLFPIGRHDLTTLANRVLKNKKGELEGGPYSPD